jgi:serine/threonine protein kinase/Tol biopolymer transport system component
MTGLNDDNQQSPLDQAVQRFVDARLRGEQPDIDEFVKQYPELEHQIREKIRNLQRINTLFDSLVQTDESDFEEINAGQNLVGQRVGSFEIVEMIGRGGMGVVYLARDTKLDRLVAIKSMPAELQASSTARTRFMREAKLLASLSHPNIAVIHDIIEQTKGFAYLVLEYVPGETLAERMEREPLQLKEAFSISLQIAEAVSAAHEEGIIHRDLKPSNIKITPDGRVKVLDFGLAKTFVSKSATVEPTVTQAGRVIGTPAYMSPEQARGHPTDRRTDIWSFGCLLYEMLTGHLPFEGETTTDVLARIIEREPDWNLLPQETPSNIRVLLWRCLAKDPHRRLQHIGDAVLEIDETLNVPADKPTVAEPLVKVGIRRWWPAVLFGVAGIGIGIIAAGIFLKRPTIQPHSEPGLVPTQRFIIELPENQALGFYQGPFSNRQPAFALSPDGLRLVYTARVSATTQLFERIIDQFEVRPIAGTEGAYSPFFSPDGQSVGFFAETDLKVVSLLGGEPVTLCSNSDPGGGSWGSDGLIYFFLRGQGLSRVPAEGGNVEPLGTESQRASGTYPQVLPGNKAVLFSSGDDAVLLSLETMDKRVLVKNARYAHYVPTGHLVYYARAGAIEAVPFRMATLEVMGSAVPVLEQVLLDSLNGTAQFVFSRNGLLVYAAGADVGRSIPAWVDRQGKVDPLPMPAQIYGTFRLSPDGKRLVILVRELQSNVYIYDMARGTGIKLTVEGNNYYPLWTPDGERIVFSRHEEAEGQWQILSAPADGSSGAEVLCSSTFRLAPCSFSSDGKLLALYKGNHDLCILPFEGQRELEPLLETDFMEVFPVFSPDSRWLAYASNRDGKFQIYARPYPAMNRVWQISTDLGEERFYRSGDNKWMVVSISTEPEFEHGTPQVLFEGPYSNVSGLSYDVTPDGQRFLVLKPQYDDSQMSKLHVITNWFEELKRLAPPSETP